MLYFRKIACRIILIFLTPMAQASTLDFINHGPGSRSSAGAGTIQSTDPAAVLYNPANLSVCKGSSFFTELSGLSLRYRYHHPDFEPASLRVESPLLLLGGQLALTDAIKIGLILLPIPGGSNVIAVNNLPSRQLSDEAGLIDVTISNGGAFDYTAGFGMSWRIFPTLALGVSVIQEQSTSNLVLSDTVSQSVLIRSRSVLTRTTANVGARWRPHRRFVLAFNAQPATTSRAEGRFLNDGGEAFNRRQRIGARYSLGAKIYAGKLRPFVQLGYQRHTETQGTVDPLAQSDDPLIDYYDTLPWIVGSELRFNRQQLITFAAGQTPASKGSGIMASETEDGVERVGMQFGEIAVMNRQTLSLGYEHRYGNWNTTISGSYHQGEQSLPEFSRGYGDYKLDIAVLSLSIGWRP